jgi:DNA-binding response OmpR family regulator
MSGKPEILCVGHDAVLNRTRRLILQRCFDVALAESVPDAESLLSKGRFALVLLCYSLTDEECSAMVEFVHSLASQPKILALGHGRGRILRLSARDEEFQPRGPAELVMKAAAMAGIGPEEARDCLPDVPARKSA